MSRRPLHVAIVGGGNCAAFFAQGLHDDRDADSNQSVPELMHVDLPAGDVHIGPSDHMPWLADRKWVHIRLEGTGFDGMPLNVEPELDVWNSPNSAGVVIDVVRCAKLVLDHGAGGALTGPSSSFMKSPPEQFHDSERRERTLRFIGGEG